MALRIPTSRDVSYANPRSGRIAPSGPTPMLGAATAAAGQAIAQAGYNLLDLAAKERVEQENNRSSEVSTSLTRFLADEEQRFIDARAKSSESGIGFTRQFMESHQQRANDFAKSNFKGLDKSAQANYVNNIISRGNSLYSKATAYEDETKAAYYDRSTNENLSTYRTQIQNNAASFDELKRQGLQSIDAVNMPEPWKAERRQKWEADAAESKWRWKFKTSPATAIDELRGAGGGDAVLDAIEDVESSGNPNALSPKGAAGLMQVMPQTGAEIAGELGDANFPVNGTEAEQQAYLSQPGVSKQYGKHYYNKMLAQYSGDKEAALVAYNGGPARADAWLASGRDDSVLPKETREYYRKVLDKAGRNTFTTVDVSQAKAMLLARTGKDSSHIEGLNDGFSVKLARLIDAAPPEIKSGLGVYSGARSVEHQAKLWKDAVAKYGSEDAARKWVAPPGKSEHNHGNAADLSFNGQSLAKAPANVVKWVHANAEQFDLKFPLANENWHIEDASTRGGKARPVDPDLDAIPYERREQLAAWGENEHSQQVTKQRAAIKDSYSLDIATQPQQVRESNILNDPMLDDGDKAALVTALRTALKETAGVDAMIKAMASGSVSVNPFDSEQKKVADLTFDKLVNGAADDGEKQAVTSDFVSRTGYIPKAVVAEVRRGAASTDASMMSQAMEASLVLNQQAPASFSAFEGSEAIRNKMELYRSYTRDMGYTPDEAARKLIRANDPELASRRESLLKSKTVADAVKKIDSSTIAASFDTSRLGLSRNPVLGPTPAAEASMVAEYRSIFEEALVDADGDMTAATKAATERFQRSYGVSTLSTLGGNVVVKNPPEKVYPAGPDGTHDYVKEQLAEAMKGQGIEADEFFLNPDIETDRDIKAGRPARYRVFYEKDGVLEQYNFPFAADPAEANQRFKAKKAEERQQSEQRSIDNRARSQAERKAVDDALSETVGPDWMKALAAEGEMERLRMDETMRGLSGEVNPGPLNGGDR